MFLIPSLLSLLTVSFLALKFWVIFYISAYLTSLFYEVLMWRVIGKNSRVSAASYPASTFCLDKVRINHFGPWVLNTWVAYEKTPNNVTKRSLILRPSQVINKYNGSTFSRVLARQADKTESWQFSIDVFSTRMLFKWASIYQFFNLLQ